MKIKYLLFIVVMAISLSCENQNANTNVPTSVVENEIKKNYRDDVLESTLSNWKEMY
ncbi:MAG: hypothetical protein AB8H03_07445 [Saprospiraceae bacterium]